MKIKITVFAFILLMASCKNLEVSHVPSTSNTPTQVTGNGVYYALPMTVLTVEIPVTTTTLKPGICFCKDEELMRSKGKLINELIKAKTANKKQTIAVWKDCDTLQFDTTSYTFYKMGDVAISSYAVPDSSKIFFATTKKNPLKKNNLTFTLNELSVLNSAEIKREDRTLEVVTQVVGSVAEVVGKLLKGEEKEGKTYCDQLKDQLKLLNDSRVKLIVNSNTQASVETLSKQLEEIDKAREAIITQFTYSEVKETTTVKIDRVILPSQVGSWINLFSFNKTKGLNLRPIPKYSYTNYYYNNDTKTKSSETDLYALNVEGYGLQMPGFVGRLTSSTIPGNSFGLAYNIPKKAAIRVAKIKSTKAGDKTTTSVDELIASANVIMPQLGTVSFLKKSQSLNSIELDPNTGALRKVSVENNAVTADQIKNIGTAAGGIVDLRKTELSTLQNEAGLLEQKEKILKLKLSIDSLSKKMD